MSARWTFSPSNITRGVLIIIVKPERGVYNVMPFDYIQTAEWEFAVKKNFIIT